MTDETYRKLLYLLQMLAQKGERETLRFIKHCRDLPLADT
jgi:hypothetical protein